MKFYKILLMLFLTIFQISKSDFYIAFRGKGAQERLNSDLKNNLWIASFRTFDDQTENISKLLEDEKSYKETMKSYTIIRLNCHLGAITSLKVYNEDSVNDINLTVHDHYCYVFEYNERNNWSLDSTYSGFIDHEYQLDMLKQEFRLEIEDNKKKRAKEKVRITCAAEAKRAIDAILKNK